jgi:hypothetical protein
MPESANGKPEPQEPSKWSEVEGIATVTVKCDGTNNAQRVYMCEGPEAMKGPFTEPIWPVYVPTPASESAGGQGGTQDDDQASGGSPAVADAQKYWADAATQARTTAKWIATSLGAALAAIIGTAPLTPLGGKDVDWLSGPGWAIVAAIALLGVTFFMVTAVLVPGMTFFTDLKATKSLCDRRYQWWIDHLLVSAAQRALGRKAGSDHGVLLPIGIKSLDELGLRIRLEEMTLDNVAEKLAVIPEDDTGKDLRNFWTCVKTGRAKIQQGYIDELKKWVIVADYAAVKVRADLARSIGLALGLAGAALLVWGYIAIQPKEAASTVGTTYVVLTVDPASPARKVLGTGCDAFSGVELSSASAGQLAIYVTGGNKCTKGRVQVPATAVTTVSSPSATPSPAASQSPLSRATARHPTSLPAQASTGCAATAR